MFRRIDDITPLQRLTAQARRWSHPCGTDRTSPAAAPRLERLLAWWGAIRREDRAN